MMNFLIKRLSTILFIVVMAVNFYILIQIRLLTPQDSFYREEKAWYILPEGFTPEKTRVSWDESPPEPSGWVVRYTSSGCIYCKMDFEWERLASQLEILNYRTILLLPKEAVKLDEEQIIPENALQMAYFKMDWIKQFHFTGTPTVVIFDNNGRLLWHRSGMLNEADYESAKRAIIKNAKG